MTLTWGCRSLAQEEFLHVGAFKREYAQESPVRGRGTGCKGKEAKARTGARFQALVLPSVWEYSPQLNLCPL